MDWPFIIFFSIVILALVIFLVMRKQKDEMISAAPGESRKPRSDEKDIENEELI